MAKTERLKEEIGWLKVVFGLFAALDVSAAGWLARNYAVAARPTLSARHRGSDRRRCACLAESRCVSSIERAGARVMGEWYFIAVVAILVCGVIAICFEIAKHDR